MPAPSKFPLAGRIDACERYVAMREGRYLVVEMIRPHRVLSTSEHRGGMRDDLRFLANHQSCEGRGDADREARIVRLGLVGYHRDACDGIGLDPDRTALMGTAANMACASHKRSEFRELRADAFVTAGVMGNAARAGDPAQWHEAADGWQRIPRLDGTINTILLLNVPVTAAAHARAVVTMTEAKSAALSDLAVPSLYSPTIATGTGTDQFCIAAPLDHTTQPLTSTSPHTKLGEVIGRAVKDAVKEALRWQNGLEASYTRSIFHALGRFGLTEERALDSLRGLLSEARFALLEQNSKAVFYEPGVAAAAYAMAAVLDRIAHGTLPGTVAPEALRQQAAGLACALSAKPGAWLDHYRQLAGVGGDPVVLAPRAIAVGWDAKWT